MLLEAYGLTVETDRKALLDFKSQVSGDKQVVLSSWNNSVHVCSWKGVTCGLKHKRVTRLDLGGFQLEGVISPYIGNLSFLISLDLSNNTFGGTIPHEIVGTLSKVKSSWRKCSFREIPSLLGNLTRLDALVLANNSFRGAIPPSLSNCTSLRFLILELNNLNGTIPQEITQIQSLVELVLSGNYLTGSLPKDVGRLDHLVHLSVEHNRLFGQIPPSLGKCLTIESLSLRGNYFDGVVPDLKGLEGLRELDFSNNNLSGSIPRYLANFTSLEYLNLSVNDFEGSVPTEGKFRNATIVSVFGNKNLCGGIKEFKLKPCFTAEAPSMGSKRSSLLKKAVIGVSVGIALLFLLLKKKYDPAEQ
ncbi:Leucine-rich repeat protein kinase family protein [Raphanus sativus]|nr:Leucine-rich repeat protein kinase family protein [Raphanus sativus]